MTMLSDDGQRDGELDRILSETEILPSSGFTASVMDAVWREATAPPAIPFPWKRALPGILVGGAVLAAVLVVTIMQLVRVGASAPDSAALDATLRSIEQTTLRFGGPWVALALLVSFASMKLSTLFVARRT